jgi:hypothetical protein
MALMTSSGAGTSTPKKNSSPPSGQQTTKTSTSEPSDQDDVLAALRLGWAMAEARGRARPDSLAQLQNIDMSRDGHVLPLGSERTPAEREIAQEIVLQSLAEKLGVDPPDPTATPEDHPKQPSPAAPGADGGQSADLSEPPPDSGSGDGNEGADTSKSGSPSESESPKGNPSQAVETENEQAQAGPPSFSDTMLALSKKLAAAKTTTDGDAAWDALAELLYRWDACIQDLLAASSEHEINAYELGRALAETYWALEPAAPPTVTETKNGQSAQLQNPVSLTFLLGTHRVSVMTRLLGRLEKYFAPLTAPAVTSSIAAWAKVADSSAMKQWQEKGSALPRDDPSYHTWVTSDDILADLRQQTDTWYSLLIAQLDPETLIRPFRVLDSPRIVWKTLQAFALEALLGLVGLIGLGLFSYFLTANTNSSALKAIFGVIGFLGVSAAGVQSTLKNVTQSIVGRLRQDLYTDLVAEEITTVPEVVKMTPKELHTAFDSRTVTAPLPA